MNDVVARTELVGQRPGEAPFPVIIEVGKPYEREEGVDEWACPTSLTPLYEKLPDAVGGDAFQALCISASLIIELLDAFQKKGGKLTFKGDANNEDKNLTFPLNAYAFGAAVKKQPEE